MKHALWFTFIAVMVAGPVVATETTPPDHVHTWRDPEQPIDVRIQDLLSRMTLEEKISQMVDQSAAIERLEIPAYSWWSECLHGVARFGRSTVFPQAIGLAATWDTDLIHRIGTAISDEGRAMFHAADRRGITKRYGGLTYWTPNVNLFRDPRWGRGQETYGEDPYLISSIGVSLINGIQGDHPRYLKAGACAKHFAVHSGPEGLRHEFDAHASNRDLAETYLPAFKALVDAGVESVMCAYNRVDGEACCGSEGLLTQSLRRDWGFQGHVVSDCEALKDFHEGHGVAGTRAEAAALALKSGVNLNCGRTYLHLEHAVDQELVTEAEIDEALAVLLRTRFRHGLFDPPEMVPNASIPTDVIGSPKHRSLAREAARKSLVLLKNTDDVLPLSPDVEHVFVIGPNASDVDVMPGNYHGLIANISTVLEGVVRKMSPGSFVQYKPGCLLDRDNVNPIDWATGDARASDVIIAVMGITPMLEGEEGGNAVADVIFGDANPSGRLPITFPMSLADLPPFNDYSMTGRPLHDETAHVSFRVRPQLLHIHVLGRRQVPNENGHRRNRRARGNGGEHRRSCR